MGQSQLNFFNNIRYLLIILVLIFHSCISYSNLVPWWFVHDEAVSPFFNLIILFLDVFVIPILFFIAGYFAIPSIVRKGSQRFIKEKLKRLGLPFFIGVVFLCPIMPYAKKIMLSHESVSLNGIIGYWAMFIKGAFNLNLGVMTSRDGFDHYHLWFVAVLLFFFIVFGLLYKIFHKIVPEKKESGPKLSILLIFGSIISIGYFFMISNLPDRHWISIYNILIFQPARLVLYIGYFSLGIYGFRKAWFRGENSFKGLGWWIFLSLFLSLSILFIIKGAMAGKSIAIMFLYSFIRVFLSLSFMIVIIGMAEKFWNRSSKIDRFFSDNSYSIYLFHLPVVVLLQFFLLNWKPDISGLVWIKFGIVAFFGLAISSLLSSFIHWSFRAKNSIN